MRSRGSRHRPRTAGTTVRSFPAEADVLADIRTLVRSLAAGVRLSERTADDVVLAISEACANAVLHSGSPDLTLAWQVARGCVRVEVSDRGVFLRRVPAPEILGGGGHGIQIMMALMDEVTIHEGTASAPGTFVRLVKC
jgi:anti-sigma regulatory factor (Ser/Thr protein kinase)